MSHFGLSGLPAIRDTFSLLVLNVSFRTTADDLFPLFDRYGNVVDIYIPRDRRTGDSRGFTFVRYKYEDEAQKAVDKLDGRTVDGRDIMVQFAKYGPNAERILAISFCISSMEGDLLNTTTQTTLSNSLLLALPGRNSLWTLRRRVVFPTPPMPHMPMTPTVPLLISSSAFSRLSNLGVSSISVWTLRIFRKVRLPML